MSATSSPAVLLAALRATGGLGLQAAAPEVVRLAAQAAEATGRSLADCTVSPMTLGSGRKTPGRGITLRWMPQCTPSPEDSHAYPVRVLPIISRLTWACCLGLAWPRRADDLYPGARFARTAVVDLAADLGAGSSWIKAAIDHDLVPAGLVIAAPSVEPGMLRLGPAAAALPEPFIEAMRRFHEMLPRPAQHQDGSDADSDDGESGEQAASGENGWPARDTVSPASETRPSAGAW